MIANEVTMAKNHPITPPPDKIHNWLQLEKIGCTIEQIITAAAQWGADCELEKCCEWLHAEMLLAPIEWGNRLRTARRPKPPSLKEQALALLDPSLTYGSITREDEYRISVAKAEIIRRALEQIPEDK
jgi:hypothetical protein